MNTMNTINTAKELKILFVTDSLDVGGAESHVISLAHALEARGHFVTVASPFGSLAKEIRHVELKLYSGKGFISPLTLFLARRKLKKLIKAEGYEILHAHARLPAFICSTLSLRRTVFFTTVHAKFKVDPLRRRLSRWGEHSFAVSEDLKIYLTERYSVSPYSVSVIANGIELSALKGREVDANFKKNEKSEPPRFNVVFLSRLDGDCSLCAELLFEVAKRLCACGIKNIRLLIGGGGEMLEKLKKTALELNESYGEEIASLLGRIEEISELFRRADVFVGVSRSAIEAMLFGVPTVIAGNEGFLGRITEKNYRLAKSCNFCARGENLPTADALFKELCFIFKNYDRATADAEKIRAIAERELNISKIVEKYEEIYGEKHRRKVGSFAKGSKKRCGTMLFGYYGYRNLGDDALLYSSLKRAEREFGEPVGAFAHKKKRAERDFSIPCRSRKNPISLFLGIFFSKRIIFGGGTLFQCSTSKRSLIFYILVLKLAQKMGRDTLLWANGIGELGEGFLKKELMRALEKCSYLGVRDEFSENTLRKELHDHSKIFKERDLALELAPSSLERAELLIKKALSGLKNSEKSFFLVSLKDGASATERFELENEIRKEKRNGAAPIFLVCSPRDIFVSRRALKKFGGGILTDITFPDLLAIVGMAKRVVSMRYHPLLAARERKVPLLAIGSDVKLKEFSRGL